MNTKLLATLVLTFLYICCTSQTTFQKTYGGTNYDYATCIYQTTDGGYILSGSTWSYGPASENLYLVKTNSNGDTLWTKAFGGNNIEGNASVQQTFDGGYIIVSGTRSFGAGNGDVYLIKTDLNGVIQWTKTYGGINGDGAYSVKQTIDGGFIIAGSTNSSGSGNSDVYLIKTNTMGAPIWQKIYGGSNIDVGTSVQQTIDQGFIINGRTNSFGAGNYDFYVIKTDLSGDTLWTKAYGGMNDEFGYSIIQTDSGYIASGFTKSFGAGLEDIYLIKMDTAGNLIWSKTIGGTDTDVAPSIQQTTDGGFILSAYTQSFGVGLHDACLIKINQVGDTLWTKTFGGTNMDNGFSAVQTMDGGYVLAGNTKSFSTSEDAYLIKTDSSGNSGCNKQHSTNMVIGIPATIVTFPIDYVYSFSGSSGTTTTIVDCGAIIIDPCLSVGINEGLNIKINNIFPNPFSTETNIQIDRNLNDATLTVYNSYGELIKTIKNISGNTIKLNSGNLINGVYFIRLSQDNKILSTEKLIVAN
jgi:hypothetical protein